MDQTILENLGLSKGEIRIYLTLLELGSTKVGQIIEKSNLASSAVHALINNLIHKGLITYIKKGKIKYYQAVHPKNLVNFVEEKKKRLIAILPELELKQKLAQEKQAAEIFEGRKGVITLLNTLIEDTKKGDEYLFFAINVEGQNKEIQQFMLNYDLKRKEKGLKIKGLAAKGMENIFSQRAVLNIKYTTFPIPSNISICNQKIAFFSWDEKPVGYLIESQQIVTIFRILFEKIWKMT